MNKLLLLLFIVCSTHIYSQINIRSDFKDKDFEYFKKTKTIVVIPSELEEEDFKKIFSELWNVTPYEFVSQETFKENENAYKKNNNSVFKLNKNIYAKGKRNIATGESRQTGEIINFSFRLYTYKKKNKKKHYRYTIANIFFSPTIKYRTEVVYGSGRKGTFGEKINKKKINNNDEESGFYTFKIGYIKNFIRILNDRLVNNDIYSLRDDYVNKNTIKNLKTKTLYAPDWILRRYAPKSSTLKKISIPEEFFEDYDYEYKVISDDELNSKILEGEPIYYLLHTQFNAQKVFAIIDAKNSKYVFVYNGVFSYNVKSSDFKKLNKAISK